VKRQVETRAAPAAIGPYSQAVIAGPFVFCSGQIPMDPATESLVSGGIEDQTRRVLENLHQVLEAAGSRMEDVVKTTVFLTDMGDFSAMNAVYAEYFTGTPPARAAVQVARLPKDARIEIEAVALRRDPSGLEPLDSDPEMVVVVVIDRMTQVE